MQYENVMQYEKVSSFIAHRFYTSYTILKEFFHTHKVGVDQNNYYLHRIVGTVHCEYDFFALRKFVPVFRV